MIRKLILPLVALAAFALIDASAATAAPKGFSPRNPYTSFNISGVNYGSVRWEQMHHRRPAAYHTHRGFFFRRR
jgi:hypothetical protein